MRPCKMKSMLENNVHKCLRKYQGRAYGPLRAVRGGVSLRQIAVLNAGGVFSCIVVCLYI